MSLSGAEQLLIEMINRTRLDPAGEAARFGIDLNEGLEPGILTTEARQVLAPNQLLHNAAEGHANWQLENNIFSHTGINGSSTGDRIEAAGYTFEGRSANGENLTYRGSTGEIDLDRLLEEDHHRDLFLSAGHRVNLLHDFYREVGVSQQAGEFTANGTTFNASMVVENFALSGSQVFVTGVAYTDSDNDDFYSIGEGQNGVGVAVDGQATDTFSAGGYAVGVAATANAAVTIGSIDLFVDLTDGNAKVDLVDGQHVLTSVDTVLESGAASLTALGVGDINLTGHDGADVLIGNAGDNVLDGGAGNDSVRFDLTRSEVRLTELENGDYIVRSSEGTDTLRSIETLVFTDQSVSLPPDEIILPDLSDAEGERLIGGGADDYLYAGGFDAGLAAGTSAQVYRLYQAALDRAPDAGGHAQWTQTLFEGQLDLTSVATGFVASREFQETYGSLGTGDFVDQLYSNVLGRDADAIGRATWVNLIENEGLSRAQAVVGFSESREFINATNAAATQFTQERSASGLTDDIFRLYSATFDRAPDLGGFESWTDSLVGGTTFTQAAAEFVRSAEFQNTYGNLDDGAFVDLLYANVLDRAADAAGRQGWLDRLESGSSRADVVEAFAQSGEFVRASAQDVRDWVAAQGVQDVIFGGSGENVLAGGALSDVFLFSAQTPGSNTVLDLEEWDVLQFDDFGFTSAAQVRALFTQQGDDVVFDSQDVRAVFEDTELASLTNDIFIV